MNDNTPHNIHDTFFRDTLSRKEVAADFLGNYLPAHVLQHIALDSLEIYKDTFVDAQHTGHYSDVLYQVSLKGGDKGFVYVLFEHKSYPDKFTSLQLLKYMLGIWELYRKQTTTKNKKNLLPLIIPVVVYHGKSKGKAVRLSDLVHIPDEQLRGYVPDFDMNFYDFSPKADEVIKGQILLQTALYCFKASHHSQAKLMVMEIFSRIACLDDSNDSLQWVRCIWRYIAQAVDIKPEEVYDIAKQNIPGPKVGEFMTLAQRLEHKGRTEGIAMGSTGILTRQLTRKFGAQTLTPAVQVRLQSASIDQLDHWGERILDAKSVNEVFGDTTL